MSEIFSGANKYLQVQAYPTVAKHFGAIEVIVLDEKPTEWLIVVDGNTDNQIRMLAKLSAHKTNELFYSLKDIMYFDESSFYVIKPNIIKIGIRQLQSSI